MKLRPALFSLFCGLGLSLTAFGQADEEYPSLTASLEDVRPDTASSSSAVEPKPYDAGIEKFLRQNHVSYIPSHVAQNDPWVYESLSDTDRAFFTENALLEVAGRISDPQELYVSLLGRDQNHNDTLEINEVDLVVRQTERGEGTGAWQGLYYTKVVITKAGQAYETTLINDTNEDILFQRTMSLTLEE